MVGVYVDQGQTVMVQPYMASVDSEGETKLVFIEGDFSHAVPVGRLLAAWEGVIQRLWRDRAPRELVGTLNACRRGKIATDDRSDLVGDLVGRVVGGANRDLVRKRGLSRMTSSMEPTGCSWVRKRRRRGSRAADRDEFGLVSHLQSR